MQYNLFTTGSSACLILCLYGVFGPISNTFAAQSFTASALIEEIIVTAQKSPQALQDTPIAISVVSGETLDANAIHSFRELYTQTPSLSFSEAGGEAQLYIRGIGTDALGVTSDPSIALHMNGAYLPRPQMGLIQFMDIERIEILRGPQGTLYGRNATGGAINIISRSPTETPEGLLQLGYGNFEQKELKATLSGPITPLLLGRVAMLSSRNDGYTQDLDTNGSNRIDDNNSSSVRVSLKTAPEQSLSVDLHADYSRIRNANQSVRPLDNLSLSIPLGANLATHFDQTRNNLSSYRHWETGGTDLALSYVLPNGYALDSLSAYRAFNSDSLFNTDGTEVEVSRTYLDYDSQQLSQEIRLSHANDKLDWLTGLYFLEERKTGRLGLGRGQHPSLGEVSFILDNHNKTTAAALFGKLTWGLHPQVDATLGLRYSYEKKEDRTNIGIISDDITGLHSPTLPSPIADRVENAHWTNASPRAVLEYRPNTEFNLYASLAKGFKSGGWNAFDTNRSYQPEYVWAYEIGVKWYNQTSTRIHGSFFYYDYQDLQVSAFKDGLTTLSNAAEATIYGAEFEAHHYINPALSASLDLALLNTQYDRFITTYGNDVVDVSGNTLTNAPRQKLSLTLNYQQPLAGGELTIAPQVSYQSRVYHSQHNEPLISQAPLTLLSGNITYQPSNRQWRMNLWGKNLTNRDYFQNTVRFTSISQGNPADSNNIGGALGYPASGRSYGASWSLGF